MWSRLSPALVCIMGSVATLSFEVDAATLFIESSERRLLTSAIGVIPAASFDFDLSVTPGPFDSNIVATIATPIRNNFGVPIGTSGGRAEATLLSDVSAEGIQLDFVGIARPPQSSFTFVQSNASFQSFNLIKFGVLESTLVRLDLEAAIHGSADGEFLFNNDTDSEILFSDNIDINSELLNHSNQTFTLLPGKTYSLQIEFGGAFQAVGSLSGQQSSGSYAVSLTPVPELSSITLLSVTLMMVGVVHRRCCLSQEICSSFQSSSNTRE